MDEYDDEDNTTEQVPDQRTVLHQVVVALVGLYGPSKLDIHDHSEGTDCSGNAGTCEHNADVVRYWGDLFAFLVVGCGANPFRGNVWAIQHGRHGENAVASLLWPVFHRGQLEHKSGTAKVALMALVGRLLGGGVLDAPPGSPEP